MLAYFSFKITSMGVIQYLDELRNRDKQNMKKHKEKTLRGLKMITLTVPS